MRIVEGKGVFGAIAIGKISFFKRKDVKVTRVKVMDTDNEVERFVEAKKETINQLEDLYNKALSEVGEANAQIFDVHKLMIEDADYNESIFNIIRTQAVNAEYAVAVTADNFKEMFTNLNDEYMKARAVDVKDVSNRIIDNLSGNKKTANTQNTKYIVCADDLTPSETVLLDKDKVLGFVTRYGSLNSHTAILARTMNIPAVIGCGEEVNEELDGKQCIVDGFCGKIYIEPDDNTLKRMMQKQEEELRKKALLSELKGKDNVTLSGKKINIYANISGLSDVGAAILNDAGGIGLFRSEFLYLESDTFPEEQKQFTIYKKVLESMAGRKVIIRTMDIGADKKIDYFNLGNEENPALGYRAIRICLTQTDIFVTQLRALYRASVYGKLSIMFPMINSLEEIKQIKLIIADVKAKLDVEGFLYSDDIEIGIMIETPAAAIISDVLAKEVDFFSVGTNDLTQYTLAVDRQNPRLERFCDTHHEAIIRLIEYAARSAHENGKWIGICGELAADETLMEKWLELGIDELSVSPNYVLPLRELVRKIK